MSDQDHKKHNHFHFGFFMVAAVALCFVFAVSGGRAADESTTPRHSSTFTVARTLANFIGTYWYLIPLGLLPFWIIHFLYAEWRFLKHVYHIVLLGIGIGFLFLYFQLDERLLAFLP